jgi:uncharacterized membrane protein YqjE
MPSDARSIRQILQDIVNHVTDIVRSEVRLATTEVRQDVAHCGRAAAVIGIAAVLGFYAVGLICLSAVYALQNVMPSWLAALLVAVVVGIVAGILYLTGRKKMAQASLRPDKTIQTLEDNVTWFKRQTK